MEEGKCCTGGYGNEIKYLSVGKYKEETNFALLKGSRLRLRLELVLSEQSQGSNEAEAG